MGGRAGALSCDLSVRVSAGYWGREKGGVAPGNKKRRKMGRGPQRVSIVLAQGRVKKGGKDRKEEERKGKIPRGQKGGGDKGVIPGGKEASILMISKSRLLVISALGKSIGLNTNFKALENNKELWFHEKVMREKGHGNGRMIASGR